MFQYIIHYATNMKKQILIIQGHPDTQKTHYGHALADIYELAAKEAGHDTKHLIVADLNFPLLRSKHDFDYEKPPEVIQQAQGDILWADHIVIIYPLWLGTMPALLKGFLEQVFRPSFGMYFPESGGFPEKLLKDKTARIIVTMGMPALFYRWFFFAHSLKSLQRNILKYSGIKHIKTCTIGTVEKGNKKKLSAWLLRVKKIARTDF